MRAPCRRLRQALPFLDHIRRHDVFDGDAVLLHGQELTAAREAAQPGGGWRKSYFTPTSSDM